MKGSYTKLGMSLGCWKTSGSLPGSLLGTRGPGLQAWPPKTTLLVKAMGLGQGGRPDGQSGPVVRSPKGYQSKQWHSHSIQKTASESLENSRHMCSVLYVQCKDCSLLSEGEEPRQQPAGSLLTKPSSWGARGLGWMWRDMEEDRRSYWYLLTSPPPC